MIGTIPLPFNIYCFNPFFPQCTGLHLRQIRSHQAVQLCRLKFSPDPANLDPLRHQEHAEIALAPIRLLHRIVSGKGHPQRSIQTSVYDLPVLKQLSKRCLVTSAEGVLHVFESSASDFNIDGEGLPKGSVRPDIKLKIRSLHGFRKDVRNLMQHLFIKSPGDPLLPLNIPKKDSFQPGGIFAAVER